MYSILGKQLFVFKENDNTNLWHFLFRLKIEQIEKTNHYISSAVSYIKLYKHGFGFVYSIKKTNKSICQSFQN